MRPESVRRLGAYSVVFLLAWLAWGAQGGNVVVNGSFENGADAWKLEVDGARIVAVGAGAADGTNVLEIDMPADGTAGFALQNLALEPDREYELSYWYQRSFEEKKFRLPVTLHGHRPFQTVARAHMIQAAPATPAPLALGWEQQTVRFFAADEIAPLQFGPISWPDEPLESGHVWVDDIAITALDSYREVDVDHDFIITLPSDAVVGVPVEVHVACMDLRDKQGGFRVRGQPVSTFATMDVVAEQLSAQVPSQIQFQGEVETTFMATFFEPGITRLRLSHSNGHNRRSNPVRVSNEALAEHFYWGDLHIHTRYNHGGWVSGDGYENYWYGRDIARLDFAALTEHFPQSAALPFIYQMSDATELFHDPGRFVTFFASERGLVEGHHNTYLRSDDRFDMADPRSQKFDTVPELLDFYKGEGTTILNVPHHFSLLDPTDWRIVDRQARSVVELYSDHGSSEEAGAWWRHPTHDGNDYSSTMGAEGHDYLSALQRGHRLGVIGASDDHFARPGIKGLTCVRAPALERDAIWDNVQARHCYATTGARMLLEFSIDGVPMGDETFLAAGTPIVASVFASGADTISSIEVVSNGEVVYSVAPDTHDYVDLALDLGPFSGESTWFYVRVSQDDEHRAWSSPIWVSPSRADLAVEPKDLVFDHATNALAVGVSNYGDASAEASVRLFTSERHHALELNQLLGDELGVVANVRPFSEDYSLVEFYLYIPASYNETFDFTGQILLAGANDYAVVHDPREMLVDLGGGRITWSEGPFGYKVSGSASFSGRISDFSILVGTDETTTLAANFSTDGVPVPDCWVGSQPCDTPGSMFLDLGLVAGETESAEESITLTAGQSGTISFPGLSPGRTYVVTVDPDDEVLEVEERNNSAAAAIPASEPQPSQWTDISEPLPVPTLEIRPKTAGMPLDDSLQLRAIAHYADGSEVDVTSVATWVPDPRFDALLKLADDGRLTSGNFEIGVRVHARLDLHGQTVRSDDAVIWASDRLEPIVLSAGFGESYLDEGNPSLGLTISARVAQRDNFAFGTTRVNVMNVDGSSWAPHGVPVALRDDGMGGDPIAGDGVHTAVVEPAPQSGSAGFELGENGLRIEVEYLLGATNYESPLLWPYVSVGASTTVAASALPDSVSDAESWVGPRVLSAGMRGFGGRIPGVVLRDGTYEPGGPSPFGPLSTDREVFFIEAEVAESTDPAFLGAEMRVWARLPSGAELEMQPSETSPGFYQLLASLHPGTLGDGLHRIDVRAESYYFLQDGGFIKEWWSSDWWPQLRLHEFLTDD